MGALRVGSLALSLRLPQGAGGRASAIQQTVEQAFIPAVLDALARDLDETYGETAVIRVRKLRIRLRIGPEVRNAADLARQIGHDLAAHVRDTAEIVQSAALPADADAEVRIWPTADVWHGAALVAGLHREPGPDGQLDDPNLMVERLLEQPSDTAIRALEHCTEAGLQSDLLAVLSEPAMRAILARFAATMPKALRTAMIAALDRVGEDTTAATADAAMPKRRRKGNLPPGATASPEPRQQDRRPQQEDPGHLPARPAPSTSDPVAKQPKPEPAIFDSAATPSPNATLQGSPTRSATVHTGDPEPVRRPLNRLDESSSPLPNGIEDLAQDTSAAWPTSWGGLVYLVTLAMRLGMPEALWRIGIPEGAALSAMLAAISGTPDDPLLAALCPGPAGSPAPPGALPDWAQDEFCTTMTAAAQDLTGHDLGDRIRMCHYRLATDGTWSLAESGAGLLLATLGDLIGQAPDAGVPTDVLAVEGMVEIGPDLICVRLPLSAIDLDIRRAGLDANPGLLPWLDKRLVIAFGSGEEVWLG